MERYPQLNRLVHTEEGFRKSVRFSGGIIAILSVVLTIGVLLLVYNIVATLRTISDNGLPASYFWRVFMSTAGTNGGHDPMLVAIVYGPLVALLVVIVLFILRKLTLNASLAKLYARFSQGGFLADLHQAGVTIQLGRTATQLYVLGTPNVPPDWVGTATQQINQAIMADRRSKEARTYLRAITRQVGISGIATQANQTDPSIPAGIFVVSLMARGDLPAIAVPQSDDLTKFRLYTLKRGTPVG